LPVPFQIERDVGEAGGLKLFRNRSCHVGTKRSRHFVPRNFYAREFIVQAHPELAEAKFAQSRFAALDQR
jgi:hypothetical protein